MKKTEDTALNVHAPSPRFANPRFCCKLGVKNDGVCTPSPRINHTIPNRFKRADKDKGLAFPAQRPLTFAVPRSYCATRAGNEGPSLPRSSLCSCGAMASHSVKCCWEPALPCPCSATGAGNEGQPQTTLLPAVGEVLGYSKGGIQRRDMRGCLERFRCPSFAHRALHFFSGWHTSVHSAEIWCSIDCSAEVCRATGCGVEVY